MHDIPGSGVNDEEAQGLLSDVAGCFVLIGSYAQIADYGETTEPALVPTRRGDPGAAQREMELRT